MLQALATYLARPPRVLVGEGRVAFRDGVDGDLALRASAPTALSVTVWIGRNFSS